MLFNPTGLAECLQEWEDLEKDYQQVQVRALLPNAYEHSTTALKYQMLHVSVTVLNISFYILSYRNTVLEYAYDGSMDSIMA